MIALLFIALMSCSRKDIVFSGSDEIHGLYLYKKNHEFELMYNGYNTVQGTYSYKYDTIYLNYNNNELLSTDSLNHKHNANDLLTRKLFVDLKLKRVCSADDKSFSVFIHTNKLQD